MPIGTSDGETFNDSFDYAMRSIVNRNGALAMPEQENIPRNEVLSQSPKSDATSTDTGFQPLQPVDGETGGTSTSEGFDKLLGAVGTALNNKFVKPFTNYAQHVHDVIQGTADPSDVGPAVDLAGMLGEGGLAMSEFKPGVGMFGGRMTKSAVNTAERMEAQGVSKYSIKEFTGLERGADGMWRREFSDVNAKYNPQGYTMHPEGDYPIANLGDVLDHPEFFNAYPEAKENVAVTTAPKVGGDERTLGMYNPQLDMIFLKEGLPAEETKSVLIHELQHYIQNHEGFNYGSPSTLPPELVDQYKGYLIRSKMGQHVDQVVDELQQGAHDEAERLAHNILVSANYHTYANQATEVEARNAQARMQMSPRQIKNTLATDTEDVPRGEQIVQQGKNIKVGSVYASGVPLPLPSQDESYVTDPGFNYKDWKMVRNSAGDFIVRHQYDDMKAHPEKYQQFIENLHGQNTSGTVKQRLGAVYSLLQDMKNGKTVTTAQMVDAVNGILDNVQGINVLKGLLGISTNAPSPEGSAGDLSYLLPPGQT